MVLRTEGAGLWDRLDVRELSSETKDREINRSESHDSVAELQTENPRLTQRSEELPKILITGTNF